MMVLEKSELTNKMDNALLKDIRGIISQAQSLTLRSVNSLHVNSNYLIGMRIVKEEQGGEVRAEYGKGILKKLSSELSREFGRGYSISNLENMRKFYLSYSSLIEEKSQTMSGIFEPAIPQTVSKELSLTLILQSTSMELPLSWSHYLFLMGISQADERRFYEVEAENQNWSLRELKRQFNSSLYERLALSRDKNGIKKLSEKGQVIEKPADVVKDPYVLEFLGLDEKSRYSETELETTIINKLEHFLLELGKGFLFEARQKRFTFDEEHFFVDLVFL